MPILLPESMFGASESQFLFRNRCLDSLFLAVAFRNRLLERPIADSGRRRRFLEPLFSDSGSGWRFLDSPKNAVQAGCDVSSG